MIKCHHTGQEINTINDYLDILSILTSILVEPQVIEYLNKTWKYRNENYDSSDNESDDEDDENKTLVGGYSEDELEAMIFIVKFKNSNSNIKILFLSDRF